MTLAAVIDVLKQFNIITETNALNIKFQAKLAQLPELVELINTATAFLQYDACCKTRLHTMIKGIQSQPVCATCGNITKMRLDGTVRYTYPTYCSSKCFSGLSTTKEKRCATSLEKYGMPFNGQGEKAIEKRIATNIERYGQANVGGHPDVMAKRIATNIERCGLPNTGGHPDVIAKRMATNIERYGQANVLTHPDVIAKKQATNIKRYGVDNVFKLQEFQDKADATMIQKYGDASPAQVPEFKKKIENTMIERYGSPSFKTSLLSEEVATLLDDPDWLTDQHHNKMLTLQRISQNLDVSEGVIRTRFTKFNIPVLTRSSSQFERDIGDFIASVYDGEIVLNTRDLIGPKEIDIYLPDAKLAFECNGVFWHGETQGKHNKYHSEKSEACEKQGVRLIHIIDKEWNTTPNIVKSRIRSLLGINGKIPARKTTLVTLESSVARKFFLESHIQGVASASITYGLLYEGQLVAAMSFGKARYSKNSQWELLRYVNSLDHTVVGGASKLFKQFVKEKQPESIVTYSDCRWNTGNMYKQLGFAYKHMAAPNYYYFVPTNTDKLYHRSQFQKHKLDKLLPIFDPQQTEWENMQANGYDRIWDCGNKVWVWTNPTLTSTNQQVV